MEKIKTKVGKTFTIHADYDNMEFNVQMSTSVYQDLKSLSELKDLLWCQTGFDLNGKFPKGPTSVSNEIRLIKTNIERTLSSVFPDLKSEPRILMSKMRSLIIRPEVSWLLKILGFIYLILSNQEMIVIIKLIREMIMNSFSTNSFSPSFLPAGVSPSYGKRIDMMFQSYDLKPQANFAYIHYLLDCLIEFKLSYFPEDCHVTTTRRMLARNLVDILKRKNESHVWSYTILMMLRDLGVFIDHKHHYLYAPLKAISTQWGKDLRIKSFQLHSCSYSHLDHQLITREFSALNLANNELCILLYEFNRMREGIIFDEDEIPPVLQKFHDVKEASSFGFIKKAIIRMMLIGEV